MLDFGAFLGLSGLALERVALDEWRHNVDAKFSADLEAAFRTIDQHHRAVGVFLVANVKADSAARLIRSAFHSDEVPVQTAAINAWEAQAAKDGWSRVHGF